jgi:hypothetical protein
LVSRLGKIPHDSARELSPAMKREKIHAGAYRIGPYRINLVRQGYWDIWLGDEHVEIDGWEAWPSMRAAARAIESVFTKSAGPSGQTDESAR